MIPPGLLLAVLVGLALYALLLAYRAEPTCTAPPSGRCPEPLSHPHGYGRDGDLP